MNSEIIKVTQEWDNLYRKYSEYMGVPEDKMDEHVLSKINEMHEYWNYMCANPAAKLYKNFANMIMCETDQIRRFIEYYDRFGKVILPEFRRPGNRYLP